MFVSGEPLQIFIICASNLHAFITIISIPSFGAVCLPGYKILPDGSCYEQKRSAIYVMKKRNMGIISDNLISAQVYFK